MHLTQDEWERGPRLPQEQDLGGALQCGGKASLERIPGVTRKTPHSFVNRNVNDDAEAIYADEWKGCLAIQDDDTRREALNHSEGEWVVGNVRTNGIKGVWSAVQALHRPGIPPNSEKHVDRCIEEMAGASTTATTHTRTGTTPSASSRAIRYATESWSARRLPVLSLRQSIQAARPGLTNLDPLEGPPPGLAACPCLPTAEPCLAARPRSARPAQPPRSGSRSAPRSQPFQP